MPSKILVSGDAAATTANLTAHELLLRVGVVSSLLCQITFVFLVLALNRLFQGVNEAQAKLMVSLVIAAVPVAIVNELFPLAALELKNEPGLALGLLNMHQTGIAIAGIFWGLWLFPFGVLIIQSGFIPKVLGGLLIVGCFSYLIDSSLALLAPQDREQIASFLVLPLAAGEISVVAWLLIKGVREPQLSEPSGIDPGGGR